MTFQLRPYQLQVFAAVWNSIIQKSGLTFSVEIARQGGKNEISAWLEVFVLSNFSPWPQNLIKCSPTFKPQTLISLRRLKEKLDSCSLVGDWNSENGYIIRLGNACAIFLSADESANVVGNTAHLLLEVDEAQDVSEEKYTREFRPMGSTTNVTNVLYGTTWDNSTLLEKIKQQNLELERLDGIQRHFRYDCYEVAKYNPAYLTSVEAERQRLGENHPLFRTQYLLLPVQGGGGFLNCQQRAQLQGEHSRQSKPEEIIEIGSYSRCKKNDPGILTSPIMNHKSTTSTPFINHPSIYVAGIDLGGEAEAGEDDYLKDLNPRHDSTVITIGEVQLPSSLINPKSCSLNQLHLTKVVEHYVWTGVRHTDLYPQMVDILKNVWHCRSVVVDATGLGQPVASFLRQALGSRVVPFEFTAPSKSGLGFDLLAAINSGRLKMYCADNSPEYREFWWEMEKARSYFRPSRTLNFYVDPSEGHDDYLMSLALLVRAARFNRDRSAHGLALNTAVGTG